MTMLTQDRSTRKRAVRDAKRLVPDDVVTANGLATHLGMTRQNVGRLTAEAVIEQRSDGGYDLTASRLKYIKHLRTVQRHTPRSQADTQHIAAKTEMLQLRLLEKRRELVKRDDVDALVDAMAGTVLTHLSGMAARCSRDLVVRRNIDAVVTQVRREISEACSKLADQRGEPLDDDAR